MNYNLLRQIILAFTIIITGFIPALSNNLTLKNAPTKVYFSPHGGCQEAIINSISTAKTTILIQAYSFTSAPIAGALKQAHDRGIKIMVILDRSQKTEKYSGLTYLQHAGIPVWIDSKHAIAHNKVIIVDNEIVITGSFNFTKSAENSNAENIIIIKDSNLAQLYTDNWQRHKLHSDSMSPCMFFNNSYIR